MVYEASSPFLELLRNRINLRQIPFSVPEMLDVVVLIEGKRSEAAAVRLSANEAASALTYARRHPLPLVSWHN